MRSLHKRWGAKPLFGFLCLAAGVLLVTWMARDVRAAATDDIYAIDADSATAGVQNTVTKNVGDTFTIDTVITQAGTAYTAHQANVILGSQLAPAGGTDCAPYTCVTETIVGSAVICGGGSIVPPSLYDGCARSNPATFQVNTGVSFTWAITCVAPGTGALHLATNAEVGDATGTNFAIATGTLAAVTVDASVTCVGTTTSTPTNTPPPTATATPVTPTSTPTPCPESGCATNTPTSTPPGTAKTATPTFTPEGSETATTVPPTTAPTNVGTIPTSPAGGAGGAGGRPITLPDTGTGDSGGSSLLYLWLGLGLGAAVAAGGGVYVKTRKRS